MEEIQAEVAELERQEQEQLQHAADTVEQHMQYLQQQQQPHTGPGEHAYNISSGVSAGAHSLAQQQQQRQLTRPCTTQSIHVIWHLMCVRLCFGTVQCMRHILVCCVLTSQVLAVCCVQCASPASWCSVRACWCVPVKAGGSTWPRRVSAWTQ